MKNENRLVFDNTSEGLREVLFHEIRSLVEGRSDERRANGIARLAEGVIKTVEVEMQRYELERRAKTNAPTGGAASQICTTFRLGKVNVDA